MRDIDAAVTASRSGTGAAITHILLWLSGTSFSTGEEGTLGLWTGDDHLTVEVAGESRTYYGAGTLLGSGQDGIREVVGLDVYDITLSLSLLSPEVEAALRGYNIRYRRVELHQLDLDPETLAPLAAPRVLSVGRADQLSFADDAPGGSSTAKLVVSNDAVMLTRSSPRKKSDESLRARHSGDGFRRYKAVSGAAGDPWGTKKDSSTDSATTQQILRKTGL